MRAFRVLVVGLLFALGAVASAEEATLHPLPLPSLDRKPLAAGAEGQKSFRVPMRFAAVEKFYREQLGKMDGITLKRSEAGGKKLLTLTSKRKDDTWAKATVKEGEVDTLVEVIPIARFDAAKVEGRGRPLVEIMISRSEEAAKDAAGIDHMEHK